jgi:hypothetical protein
VASTDSRTLDGLQRIVHAHTVQIPATVDGIACLFTPTGMPAINAIGTEVVRSPYSYCRARSAGPGAHAVN